MLYNITKERLVLEKVEIADSFLKKFLGLMGRKCLEETGGLALIGCSSIHTCFMRFAIDVVFLNKNNEVILLKRNVRSWRAVNIVKNAHITIEMRQGAIDKCGISNGDMLVMI